MSILRAQKDQINISISNRQNLPIQILNINSKDNIYKSKTNNILSSRSLSLLHSTWNHNLIGKKMIIELRKILILWKYEIKYKVLGTSRVFSVLGIILNCLFKILPKILWDRVLIHLNLISWSMIIRNK